MRTYELIKLFEAHVKEATGVNVAFTFRDFSVDEYPVVCIQPGTGDSNIIAYNSKSLSLDIPLKIKVMVQKERLNESYDILDKLLRKSNQFRAYEGHAISGNVAADLTDGVFVLSVDYLLKNIIQES